LHSLNRTFIICVNFNKGAYQVNNQLTTDDFIDSQLKQFNVTDQAIQKLKDEYFDLNIKGIDDKEGYNVVKAARLHVRSFRTELEEKRKELVENPMRIKQAIDNEAKRRREQLEEIESHLKEKELEYELEVKRLKDEQDRLERERVKELEIRTQKRIQQLYLTGFQLNGAIYQAIYINHISEYSLDFIKDSDDKTWEHSFNLDVVRFEEFKKQKEEKALAEAEEKRIAEIARQEIAKQRQEEADRQAQKIREQHEFEQKVKQEEFENQQQLLAKQKAQLDEEQKLLKAAQVEAAKENEKLKIENAKLVEAQKNLEAVKPKSKIKKPKKDDEPILSLYDECIREWEILVPEKFKDCCEWEDIALIFKIFTEKCAKHCLDLDFKQAALKLVEK